MKMESASKSLVLISTVLAFFCAGTGLAQMEIKNERTFTGTALYDFINEGVDLYFEYGFIELVSSEVIYKGEEFKVNVFTMNSPLAAFGIYSVNADKCIRVDSLGRFDCQSKNHLLTVDGNNYVSIEFSSGCNAARKIADELYEMFVADGKTGIRLPGQLMYMTASVSGAVKYIKGKLGVAQVQPSLTELLKDIDSYEIWHVENVDKDNLILFLLQTGRDCNILQKRIPNEKIIRKGEKFVMMKE